MLYPPEQRLVDAATEAAARLPGQGSGLNTVLPSFAYAHPDADPPRLLRFNARHWQAVTSGAKTATTRLADPTRPGPVTLLFEFDERYRSLAGVVDSIETVRFDELTDAQAALEGCTADELRAGLRTGYYPSITDDDLVDFVRFHVAEATGPADVREPESPK